MWKIYPSKGLFSTHFNVMQIYLEIISCLNQQGDWNIINYNCLWFHGQQMFKYFSLINDTKRKLARRIIRKLSMCWVVCLEVFIYWFSKTIISFISSLLYIFSLIPDAKFFALHYNFIDWISKFFFAKILSFFLLALPCRINQLYKVGDY